MAQPGYLPFVGTAGNYHRRTGHLHDRSYRQRGQMVSGSVLCQLVKNPRAGLTIFATRFAVFSLFSFAAFAGSFGRRERSSFAPQEYGNKPARARFHGALLASQHQGRSHRSPVQHFFAFLGSAAGLAGVVLLLPPLAAAGFASDLVPDSAGFDESLLAAAL